MCGYILYMWEKYKYFYQKEVSLMARPQARANHSNSLVVPGAESALEQMKLEIAHEFGVQLGAETTARSNGSVGGEITRRLIAMAQRNLG
jgi:hypothetical protein